MVEKMNDDPIIFAMANPEPEIMPEVAKAAGAEEDRQQDLQQLMYQELQTLIQLSTIYYLSDSLIRTERQCLILILISQMFAEMK